MSFLHGEYRRNGWFYNQLLRQFEQYIVYSTIKTELREKMIEKLIEQIPFSDMERSTPDSLFFNFFNKNCSLSNALFMAKDLLFFPTEPYVVVKQHRAVPVLINSDDEYPYSDDE